MSAEPLGATHADSQAQAAGREPGHPKGLRFWATPWPKSAAKSETSLLKITGCKVFSSSRQMEEPLGCGLAWNRVANNKAGSSRCDCSRLQQPSSFCGLLSCSLDQELTLRGGQKKVDIETPNTSLWPLKIRTPSHPSISLFKPSGLS